ncbi:type II toxin-antitoxin system HicA family toxin [Brachybacterium kimchii]|uniref:Uncharacterized protein n=1 Tax=Brachybacterium kimchii TaxID=2942909 RepID=A0ABY4N3G1_9MICO|nr:type II toxin-antitoxin system HicA family toxin [Brachybacterium kimchii]UQN29103.1 hypothetical protein M4486_15945 [Brachybacterium kimchii]
MSTQEPRTPRPAAPSARPAVPSPAALRGRPAPAARVRPVDWTATGRRAPDQGETRGGSEEERPGQHRTHGTATPQDPSAGDRLPAHRRARTVELPRPAQAPPAEAVHSLVPEDPRPNLRPLTIDEGAIRTVGVTDVPTETIVHTVADPEESWSADAGTSDHFLRGDLVVQVHRAENAVIGLFTSRYALSVRPEEYEDALDAAIEASGRSARGGRGTRHPTTRRELLARMEKAGFVVTPGAGHGRVAHPDHPGLFVPFASTPSDVRFTRHAVAQIRRVFGIDLRH